MKKDEREWLSKVAEFGCCVCRWFHDAEDSPAMIHHMRHGMGIGQRADSYHTLPLCGNHHQHGGHGVAIHGGIKAFEAAYDTELNLYHRLLDEL